MSVVAVASVGAQHRRHDDLNPACCAGLTGSVLVPEDGKVQIVCQGAVPRLKSFSEWLETESQLVTKVQMIEVDACPVVPLSNKFPLADAEDEANQPWANLLREAQIEIDSAKGITQSNDEGLF